MKLLLLLFFVGFATAFVVHSDNAVEEDLVLATEGTEGETKTELGKHLQKFLDALLNKWKEEVEKGKMMKEEFKEKAKKTWEILKNAKTELKDITEVIKEVAKKDMKEIWELWWKKESTQVAHADFNLREMFKNLRDTLLSKIDKEKLKAKIEEIFGKGSELADSILDIVNKKGDKYKQKLLDLVDRFLGKDEERRKRSLKEVWEKVRDYFKDLHIDLKEKYAKFGEWVKNTMKEHVEKGKTKIENIRNIAEEFIEHSKGVSNEVAVEAMEFMQQYKEDLGGLWDKFKEEVLDIIKRKD